MQLPTTLLALALTTLTTAAPTTSAPVKVSTVEALALIPRHASEHTQASHSKRDDPQPAKLGQQVGALWAGPPHTNGSWTIDLPITGNKTNKGCANWPVGLPENVHIDNFFLAGGFRLVTYSDATCEKPIGGSEDGQEGKNDTPFKTQWTESVACWEG